MNKSKQNKGKKLSTKDKKLNKLINTSDAEEDTEHALSYYLNDRVKMMKEVLKIIKPKKIRTMTPNCMKNLDNEEINSMLLEELLGISNKRLKAIFNGQELNEDSSSTEEEEEKPVDIISLDDITDDDFIINLDSDNEKGTSKKHKSKVKQEHKIKKEKKGKLVGNKSPKREDIDRSSEQNLMSVLELLELQARARAIRSQLALENSKKNGEEEKQNVPSVPSDNDEDAVIVESPKETEIIISSSESDEETNNKNNSEVNTNKKSDLEKEIVDKPQQNVESEHNDDVLDSSEKTKVTSTDNTSQPESRDLNEIPLPSEPSNDQPSLPCSDQPNESSMDKPSNDPILEPNSEPSMHQPSEPSSDQNPAENKRKPTEDDTDNTENPVVQKEAAKKRQKRHKHHRKSTKTNKEAEIEVKEQNNDSDGIVLNLEQSEMDCIHLD